MPEKGTKVTVSPQLANVLHRTWPANENRKAGEAWDISFIGVADKMANTYSKTCADALTPLIGQEVTLEMEYDREFKDVEQWKVLKALKDGKVIYEPSAAEASKRPFNKSSGYSRPDWSYETAEERLTTRLSIEAQKSADVAMQLTVRAMEFDNELSKDDALQFLIKATNEIAHTIRGLATESSGAGRGSRRETTSDGHRPPSGSSGDEPQEATRAASPSATQSRVSLPAPEPSVASEGGWS